MGAFIAGLIVGLLAGTILALRIGTWIAFQMLSPLAKTKEVGA